MNDSDIQKLSEMSKKVKGYNQKVDDIVLETFLMYFEKVFGNVYPISILEELLTEYEKRRDDLINNKMPAIMIENEMKSITLDDGTKLTLKKIVNPKVNDKQKMITWVESIGMEDAIKTNLEFKKGEVDSELVEHLEKSGYSYTRDDSVHYQTLSKIVRDRYKNGDPLPPVEAVEIIPFDTVKVL
jgi:hypothetical protein